MADDLAVIAAFIAARLRDDSALATAVATCCRDSRKPWPPEQVPGQGGPVLTEYLRHFGEYRALADVDSTRELVKLILTIPHVRVDDPYYCCSQSADPENPEEGPGSGCWDSDRAGRLCDCGRDARVRRMLAAVAARWEGHPEHGEGWAA